MLALIGSGLAATGSFLLAAISATPFLGSLVLPTLLTAAAPKPPVPPGVQVYYYNKFLSLLVQGLS